MVRRHYGTVYRTGLAGELPNSFMTSVVSGTGETLHLWLGRKIPENHYASQTHWT